MLGRAALDEIADDARLEHLEHGVPVGGGSQREHLRVRRAAPQLAGDLDTAATRHAHVDDRDVRPRRAGELDRLVRVARGADELKGRLGVDECREHGAQLTVVLGYENRDHPSGIGRARWHRESLSLDLLLFSHRPARLSIDGRLTAAVRRGR